MTESEIILLIKEKCEHRECFSRNLYVCAVNGLNFKAMDVCIPTLDCLKHNTELDRLIKIYKLKKLKSNEG